MADTLRVGDTVCYSNPTDAEEAEFTFTLIEHNGDRVLIELEAKHCPDWRIKPRSMVALSEVTRVFHPFE